MDRATCRRVVIKDLGRFSKRHVGRVAQQCAARPGLGPVRVQDQRARAGIRHFRKMFFFRDKAQVISGSGL